MSTTFLALLLTCLLSGRSLAFSLSFCSHAAHCDGCVAAATAATIAFIPVSRLRWTHLDMRTPMLSGSWWQPLWVLMPHAHAARHLLHEHAQGCRWLPETSGLGKPFYLICTTLPFWWPQFDLQILRVVICFLVLFSIFYISVKSSAPGLSPSDLFSWWFFSAPILVVAGKHYWFELELIWVSSFRNGSVVPTLSGNKYVQRSGMSDSCFF